MSPSDQSPDRRLVPSVSRRNLIAGSLAALVTVVAPLIVWGRQASDEPELRVLRTRDRATTLIADGSTRVLVVNSPDREAVREAIGRASRPWEPLPHLLISPSDDDAAVGLLEAIERSRPHNILVAGVPGADPVWARIAQLCRERAIPVQYVTTMGTAETERLQVTVLGADPEERKPNRAAIVRRGETNVVIAFDTGPQPTAGQVLIANHVRDDMTADMLVTVDDTPRRFNRDQILVNTRDLVRIALTETGVEITGGTYRGPRR
jgi:hypothetical protein